MYMNETYMALLSGLLGRALVLDIYAGCAWAAELRVCNRLIISCDLYYL